MKKNEEKNKEKIEKNWKYKWEKRKKSEEKKCRWHGENLSDSRFCKKREKGNTVMVSQSQ